MLIEIAQKRRQHVGAEVEDGDGDTQTTRLEAKISMP